MSRLKKYSFIWVTLALFFASLGAHWVFGWLAYRNEGREHAQPVQFREYAIEMGRDTFENWQSEFLQLFWQVAGLAMLLCRGSPQSKEGADRIEAKLDWLLSQSEDGRRRLHEINCHLGRH